MKDVDISEFLDRSIGNSILLWVAVLLKVLGLAVLDFFIVGIFAGVVVMAVTALFGARDPVYAGQISGLFFGSVWGLGTFFVNVIRVISESSRKRRTRKMYAKAMELLSEETFCECPEPQFYSAQFSGVTVCARCDKRKSE